MRLPSIKSAPWRIIALSGTVLATGVVYVVATGITKWDVSRHYGLEHPSYRLLQAGDIVAYKPGGVSLPERICSQRPEPGDLRSESIDKHFYNVLASVLPSFAALFGVAHAGDTAAETRPVPGLDFVGRVSELEVTSSTDLDQSCSCEIARRINRREQVCTVTAALTEYTRSGPGERGEISVAINLGTWANVERRETFAACNLPWSPTAEAIWNNPPPCNAARGRRWDVEFRNFFNLIRDRDRDHDPAAPGGGDLDMAAR